MSPGIEVLDGRIHNGDLSSPGRPRVVFDPRGGEVVDLRNDIGRLGPEKGSVILPEQVVAFDRSSDLSEGVRRELIDSNLLTVIFPMLAKNWWRFVHCVGTAEIFEEARHRGELDRAGFDIPEDRARQIRRSFAAHDLGMAFTRQPETKLNPRVRMDLKADKTAWDNIKRHPVLTDKRGRSYFSPLELDLMGEHQSRGRIRQTYGRNPYKESSDPSEWADEREHKLFAKIDILQASTDPRRLYQNDISAEEALAIIRRELGRSDPQLDVYLSQLAYDRRGFALVPTLPMQRFIDSLREGGENQRYWSNPSALAGVFSHNFSDYN